VIDALAPFADASFCPQILEAGWIKIVVIVAQILGILVVHVFVVFVLTGAHQTPSVDTVIACAFVTHEAFVEGKVSFVTTFADVNIDPHAFECSLLFPGQES